LVNPVSKKLCQIAATTVPSFKNRGNITAKQVNHKGLVYVTGFRVV